MEIKNKELSQAYWNDFYKNTVIDIPSQFCVYVATDLPPKKTIVEFGSGSGRDALYLANQGYKTVAIDLSRRAVQLCRNTAASRSIEHAFFIQGDMSSEDDLRQVIERARATEENEASGLAVYSRFVMHTLDDEQEAAFLAHLGKYLGEGDSAYFEFRSKEDEELEKHYGGHYRRYVDTDRFVDALITKHGFDIEYRITGQGMARFREEDPFVSRIVARK